MIMYLHVQKNVIQRLDAAYPNNNLVGLNIYNNNHILLNNNFVNMIA